MNTPRPGTESRASGTERSAASSRLGDVLNWAAPGVALAALLGIAATSLTGCSGPEPDLPVYWEAPEFTLLDQLGDTVRTADLRGTPWVASFVFTGCTSVCPLITEKMAGLRDSLAAEGRLGSEVRLVSFSVDPARDTPGVLRDYAADVGGSPPQEWAFLTGSPPEAVRSMVQEGFKLTAVAPPGHEHAGGDYQVMHSPRVLLVDAEGLVRGLYETTEPDSMEQLGRDLHVLLREKDP